MSHQQHADITFGPRLKAHRERRGITLEALAASTKIKASLLADLEDNNITRWPEGIYRRARLRAYVTAIGMPPEPVLEEFTRLFPDPGETDANTVRGDADAPPLRLTFADTCRRGVPVTRSRVTDALSHFVVVLACGGVLMALSGLSFWTASGTVALIWYPLAGAIYGGPSPRWLRRWWAQVPPTAPVAPEQFVGAPRRASGGRWLPVLRCRVRSMASLSRARYWSALTVLAASRNATRDRTAATDTQPGGRRFVRIGGAFRSWRLASSLPHLFGERGVRLLPRLFARSSRRDRRRRSG